MEVSLVFDTSSFLLVSLWSPPEPELSSVPSSSAVTVEAHCSFIFSVSHVELILRLRGILQTHEG